MKFGILAAAPGVLDSWLGAGVIGRARSSGALDVEVRDVRDWATDRHRTIDDAQYGGGPGMVMKPDVVVAAIEALRTETTDVVLLSPACTSYDAYDNFEERGEDFRRIVRRLASKGGSPSSRSQRRVG
jgi:tRNA (guanine37-N1)-methyltransferase